MRINNERNYDMENINTKPAMPAPPVYAPPPKREFTVADTAISLACLALGLMFTHFVCENAGGLWGGIMWLLAGITGGVYVKIKKLPVKRIQIITFGIALFFCLTPLFCANPFINSLAAAFTFLLYFYLCITLSGAEPFGEHFISDLFKSVLVQPFSCFGGAPKAAGKLLKNQKAGKTAGMIILGLIVAIPLSFVVLLLLMSSDSRFENLIEEIMDSLPHFKGVYIAELGFGVLAWMYLFGGLSAASEHLPSRYPDMKKFRLIPSALGYAAVTPVCIFYIMYIAVQFSYITSAFAGALPDDYSYSSYARKGFFELCVVAVINMTVIVFLQCFMRRKEDDKRPVLLKAYTTAISGFTLLLIASAISKMVLYINEMGMTPLRIYTSWFMILLAIIFVLVIISQFTGIKFWLSSFAAFTAMMAVLCFGNFDGMIADYNVTAYETGKLESVDFDVLEELGEPAIVHVERLLDNPDKHLADYAAYTYQRILEESEEHDGFAYFSFVG